ncbi:MAG: hypothetical protein QXQ90_00930 [Desulfurococcaceae archaeon]
MSQTQKYRTKYRTIKSTGPKELYVKESERGIMIVNAWYPLYPYGNYVKDVIELNVNNKTLEYYTARDGWNGTGTKHHGHVELTDDEVIELREAIRNVKSFEDFDKLVEKFEELKKKREEEIDRAWEEIADKVTELIRRDEELRSLKISDEELEELVEEFMERLVERDA